jgi:GAF domain-containing protein
MAETFDPDSLPAEKAARYAELAAEIAAVLEGERDPIARLATIAAMLHQSFDRFLWTGFYMVDPVKPDELVVGPYQGTLGCLRIRFGAGVCGTAASERRTLIVPDVQAFAGHIACDDRSRSEIVVPLIDSSGRLAGVLDVDSAEPAAFDETDALWLERILAGALGR